MSKIKKFSTFFIINFKIKFVKLKRKSGKGAYRLPCRFAFANYFIFPPTYANHPSFELAGFLIKYAVSLPHSFCLVISILL